MKPHERHLRVAARPPRLAAWLLGRLTDGATGYGAEGDLEENFHRMVSENGAARAKVDYWRMTLHTIPGFLENLCYWGGIMFSNYLKIAMRNFSKQKSFSLINLAGLGTGMAAFILISLWVQDELSYNRTYPGADNIYRLYRQLDTPDGRDISSVCPAGTRAALKGNYPGVVDVVSYMTPRWVLSVGDRKFTEKIAVASPSIFDVFSIKFTRGERDNALESLGNIVITGELAGKLFGDEDPIGKTIQVETWYQAVVTGVIEALPARTTVSDFNAVINIDILAPLWGRDMSDMKIGNYMTYLLKAPEAQEGALRAGIQDIFQPFYSGVAQDGKGGSDNAITAKLVMQPLLRERLHNIEGGGLITYLYIFSAVGVLILLVACFNFMNLSTARAKKRATEVGIRRVIGATRPQLARQFFGEAVIMSCLAALMAIALTWMSLPWFNGISGKEIVLAPDVRTVLLFLAVTLITGVVSGTYPATVLSSLQPASALKIRSAGRGRGVWFRRTLVVSQFAISIFLVIGSLVIYRQLDYIKNKDLGFNTNNVLEFQLSSNLEKQFDAFRQTLTAHPGISGVTKTNAPPIYRESSVGNDNIAWEGKGPEDFVSDFGLMGTDAGFLDVFRPEVVTGRFFSDDFPSDMESGAVINESASKLMGFEDPVGKTLTTYENTYTIIGVVKDFHLETLHHGIKPLAILPGWGVDGICVSISAGDPSEAMAFIEETVRKFDSGANLKYTFLDDMRMAEYGTETRTESIIRFGAVLAIFISCLGLLGLAIFTAEERTREIGIRKVLGSSITGIVVLLTGEFMKWILVANLIAWPLAWFAARRWLDGFAYRTNIDLLVFFAAGFAAFLIGALAVGWQAFRAARANPVDSLKYE